MARIKHRPKLIRNLAVILGECVRVAHRSLKVRVAYPLLPNLSRRPQAIHGATVSMPEAMEPHPRLIHFHVLKDRSQMLLHDVMVIHRMTVDAEHQASDRPDASGDMRSKLS